jgi:hypothetical protein
MRRAIAVLVTAGQKADALVIVLLLIAGSACIVVGVYMLAGTPASLLAAGTLCLALAILLLRGIDPNV